MFSIFAYKGVGILSAKQQAEQAVVCAVRMLIHTDVKKEEEANVKDEEGARGRSRFRQ